MYSLTVEYNGLPKQSLVDDAIGELLQRRGFAVKVMPELRTPTINPTILTTPTELQLESIVGDGYAWRNPSPDPTVLFIELKKNKNKKKKVNMIMDLGETACEI